MSIDGTPREIAISLGINATSDVILVARGPGSYPGPCFQAGLLLENLRLE